MYLKLSPHAFSSLKEMRWSRHGTQVKKIRWRVWWTVFSYGHGLSSSKSNMVTSDSKTVESSRASDESVVDLPFSSLILQNTVVDSFSCKSEFLWGWRVWGGRKDCVDKLWEIIAWKAGTPKDETGVWMKWVGSAKLVILRVLLKWKIIPCINGLCFLHNIWSWLL